MTNEPAATAASTKTPTHYVYTVKEGTGGSKSIWTKIGAAWSHADHKGFSVQLDALPIDGKLSLRIPAEDKA